jgi:hypothetical protein
MSHKLNMPNKFSFGPSPAFAGGACPRESGGKKMRAKRKRSIRWKDPSIYNKFMFEKIEIAQKKVFAHS